MPEAAPARAPQIYPASWTESIYPAGDWALEEKTTPRMVMGRGSEILWADEESFIIVGDTGYGKSTLTQNIIKASVGLSPEVLGMEVRQFDRILYIAADRPPQIKASMARMIDQQTRECWNTKVLIHEGPIGFAVNKDPEKLVSFAAMPRDHWGGRAAEMLVIDSLKDIASAISDDEQGMQYNIALQNVCREGIQLLGTHHPRKAPTKQQKSKEPEEPTLDDVYGSKFITAGAGSVLMLHDRQREGVQLTHLKAPAGVIEFPRIRFDGQTGSVIRVVSNGW